MQSGQRNSSMRHPFPQLLLRAVEPGPAISGSEHLRKVIHPIEVGDFIGLLLRQQADLDQEKHDPSQVGRGADAPVVEHGAGEQDELLQREVAAGPRQLRPRQMAARGQAALGVLEGGQDKEIGALVVAAVAQPDGLERGLERELFVHARALVGVRPRGRAGAVVVAAGMTGSSASSSTWSMVSTFMMSIKVVTSSGTSTRSLAFLAGTSTVLMPARAAAVSFSFSPPIGSTRPRSVSSPVIATSWRAGLRQSSDASAAAMVMPAEGPAFGTPPAGTCRCASDCVNASSGMPSALARARSRLHAACADSFITSPSWPVSVIWPLPGIRIASMNMMSPPTGVHASPVATPISGARPATSLCTLGCPAYFSRFLAEILTQVDFPSTTSSAALRRTPWISRSICRTPASRVYSPINRSEAPSATWSRSVSPPSPVSFIWRGSR